MKPTSKKRKVSLPKKFGQMKSDELWLSAYHHGYRDAITDAHCGLIKGLQSLPSKVTKKK